MVTLSEEKKAELIAMRRHFHAHPELSLEERETSAYIERYLQDLGLTPMHVGEYGLVVTIFSPKPNCKTVAIRAEMDAIAVEEKLPYPWRSQNPRVMHACGHDGILATVLVLAKLCAENTEVLSVNVKFLFQSAEENGKGTDIMLDHGAMEDPHADYFVMMHYVSDTPSGVELQRGASSATIGSVDLRIHGKASHWCTRELGIDTISAAGKVLQAIETINTTYQTDSPFILGIGTISGGTAKNVIAEETHLLGTLRACRKEDYFQLRQLLLERLHDVERECGVVIDAQIEDDPIPPIINDEALVALATRAGRPIWGKDCRITTKKFLSGDSASRYFDYARGIFVVFTAAKPDEENYPLHNGHFDFDESVMEKAVVFLYEYLNQLPGDE